MAVNIGKKFIQILKSNKRKYNQLIIVNDFINVKILQFVELN